MKNKIWKAAGLLGLCVCVNWVSAAAAEAAEIAVETSTTLYAKIDTQGDCRLYRNSAVPGGRGSAL